MKRFVRVMFYAVAINVLLMVLLNCAPAKPEEPNTYEVECMTAPSAEWRNDSTVQMDTVVAFYMEAVEGNIVFKDEYYGEPHSIFQGQCSAKKLQPEPETKRF